MPPLCEKQIKQHKRKLTNEFVYVLRRENENTKPI
nr:MAG TPA: hypothetical protein [Bacteriophage sp.]